MRKNVMDEVKRLFRPEFLNRIDEVIVFHSLTKENIREIVGIMLNQVSKRLQKKYWYRAGSIRRGQRLPCRGRI